MKKLEAMTQRFLIMLRIYSKCIKIIKLEFRKILIQESVRRLQIPPGNLKMSNNQCILNLKMSNNQCILNMTHPGNHKMSNNQYILNIKPNYHPISQCNRSGSEKLYLNLMVCKIFTLHSILCLNQVTNINLSLNFKVILFLFFLK